MNNQEIAALVARAKANDPEAFALLYEGTWKKCYYLAYSHLQNAEDAQDVVQETFIDVQTKIQQLKENEAFSAWVSRIVYNKSMDLKRNQIKYQSVDIEDLDNELLEEREDFLPSSILKDQGACDDVAMLISNLPEEQKIAILLYYFNQLSTAEIADVMGTSPNSVMLRLSRARAKIKLQYEKHHKQVSKVLMALAPVPVITEILTSQATEVCAPEISQNIWNSIEPFVLAATGVATVAGTAAAAGTTAAAGTAGGAGSGAAGGASVMTIASVVAGVTGAVVIGTGIFMAINKDNPPASSSSVASFPVVVETSLMESTSAETSLHIEIPTTVPITISSETVTESTVLSTTSPSTTIPTPLPTTVETTRLPTIIPDLIGFEGYEYLKNIVGVSVRNPSDQFPAFLSNHHFFEVSAVLSLDGMGDEYILYAVQDDSKRLLVCEYINREQGLWGIAYDFVGTESEAVSGDVLADWFQSRV